LKQQTNLIFISAFLLASFICNAKPNKVEQNSESLANEYYKRATELVKQSNSKEAMMLAEKSAELGHSEAQFLLAFMYEHGKSGKTDTQKSIYWYTKASLQGNSNAQFNLALLHSDRDEHNKAFRWMRSSAQQENVKAQYNLGVFYFNGTGTTKDINKSLYWLKMAKNGRNPRAEEYIKNHNLIDSKFIKGKNNYLGQNLAPESNIELVSVVQKDGVNFYTTSTNITVSEEHIYLIRRMCELYGRRTELAELLLDVQLSEGRRGGIWIQPKNNSKKGLLNLYLLAVLEKSFLRMRIQNSGKDLLVLKSLEIMADDHEWKSPENKPQSHLLGVDRVELIDVLIKDENVKMFKKMAYAEKVNLKLVGASETIEKKLSQRDKNSLVTIFRIYEILMN